MPNPPSTDNYTIGKGILYIAEWGSTGPGAYEDMGNVTACEVEPTLERLPHYSSRSGFRTKDKNPIIQTEYMVNFTADEICAANINRFVLGTMTSGQIKGMQGANKEFALKFVADNPIGQNKTWNFWKATLGPAGPLALIGEEWMAMEFTAEGLADTVNHSDSPYFDVTWTTTTTTTTTTV